jgi:hypothetical protein
MLNWSSNPLRVVVDKRLQDCCTKQFGIAVAVEATCKGTSLSSEEAQGTKDIIGTERFLTALGCRIHKY